MKFREIPGSGSQLNVLGGPLMTCSDNPVTGFLRDVQDLHPVEFSISELSGLRRQLKDELDEEAKKSEYLIELSAAFTRYQAVALKLATLYAISLGEWGGEIPLEAMECAVNAIRLLKTSILDILGNVVPFIVAALLLIDVLFVVVRRKRR